MIKSRTSSYAFTVFNPNDKKNAATINLIKDIFKLYIKLNFFNYF